MPISHTISDGLVQLKVAGRVLDEELIVGFESMLGDGAFPKDAHVLIDVVESEAGPAPETMQRIAGLLRAPREARPSRIAIVVAHDIRYGLARQLGIRLEAGGIAAQPFRHHDEALIWLKEESG